MSTKLDSPNKLIFKRLPKDNDELHAVVSVIWGYEIPREKVCENHCAPFDAFADAYFARYPVIVIKASRGFGGKSMLLGMLSHTEFALLNAQVTVLGGSSAQSKSVHAFGKEAWESSYAPKHLLASDPTQFTTEGINGSWILALLASQTSVRGPHPQRLRLDEIDEMSLEILEAAQGQPLDGVKGYQKGVKSQTVMSSTHQYPDGTMSTILKRANDRGWPIYEWCYRENMGPGGWLTKDQVERKRSEITEGMWNTEFELQEPNFKSRAVAIDDLHKVFDESLGVYEGVEDEIHFFQMPERNCSYTIGADWAKENDWTVIRVFKTNTHPWEEVAFLRTNRRKWQDMTDDFNELREMYSAIGAHDATGLGGVIDDLVESDDIYPIILQGRDRERIFTDYLFALESRAIKSPMVKWMFNEHKFLTRDDLFTSSGHPPDSFVAGAVAYSRRLDYKVFDYTPFSSTSHDMTRESPWSI